MPTSMVVCGAGKWWKIGPANYDMGWYGSKLGNQEKHDDVWVKTAHDCGVLDHVGSLLDSDP